jgi:hypothetical protein
MAGKYFTNFPLDVYSNSVSTNILTKIGFQEKLNERFYVFHPYTIKEGDRPDTIAYLYYGDPMLDWIVLFSNNIVDPYYDWYMDTNTFRRFINDKYGSISNAQSKVKFYRSNYLTDFSVLSLLTYNNLSENKKKYWNPILSATGSVSGYERKREEIIHSTNMVKQLNITLQGNTPFSVDENAYQLSGVSTTAIGGVKVANSSTLIVDSIQGTFANTTTVKGSTSGANASVLSIVNLSTTIPSDELLYYEPVSFYDYENELNEKKKNIKLLDASYVPTVLQIFKELTND